MKRLAIITNDKYKYYGELLASYLSNHPDLIVYGNIYKDQRPDKPDHPKFDNLFKEAEKSGKKAIVFYMKKGQMRKWIEKYFDGNSVITLGVPDLEWDYALSLKDLKLSKDNKWRNIIKRRFVLKEILDVKDTVLNSTWSGIGKF